MADEEDFSSLPLEQRLEHKVWKVRMNAYTDLAKELRQLDPERESGKFGGFESLLGKIVLDGNMAAQETGLLAVIAFVENAPHPVRRRDEIVGGIVAKCLAATKAGTRTNSKELLMLLSEADTPAPVVAGVVEGFDAKQPKAVAAAVAAVRELVHAFGVKFIALKPLLKALAKPFAHRDNGVRAEAQQLAVELFRWMGPAIMPSLQDLPPVLLKELEAQFAAVAKEPPPKQQRLLRSQQEADEPADAPAAAGRGAEASDGEDDGSGDAGAGMDPWDLADPVDITKKLSDDYHEFIASKKWKERKEVLEHLHAALQKAVRLQMSPGTGDVIQELGKKIGDTNIIVATLAIQCLELLASGLRQPFAPYVQSMLPALVEKSKERKQTVVDAIRATADAYFRATGCDLAAIGDHYFTGATHKNPQVRAEAHHFLRRSLAAVATRPGKGDIKKYADQLKSGLDDGDAGVREAAAEGLGTLSKLVTAKVLDPFIEGVDKIKLEKIGEYAAKATVKAKAAPKPRAPAPKPAGRPRPRAPAPAAAAADDGDAQSAGLGANLPPHIRKKLEASARAAAIKKAQREGRPIDDLLPPPPAEPAPAPKPAAPRPAAAKPAAPKRLAAAPAARKPAGKAAPAGAAKGGEAIKMRFANDESLDEKIAAALPAGVLEGLSSAKWKDRVEAMDQLRAFLGDEAAGGGGVHPELVVRQLARRPGWKESNFQVTSRAFQLIAWMAGEEQLEFSTGAAALSVPALVDKLGDIKLKGPAGDALAAMAERFTLQLVVGLALEPIRGQKSPKVAMDCLAWLNTQLLEFGVQGVGLRAVADVARDAGLQSSSAQTRATAVGLMGTLRRAVGPAVLDLVGDLNPQLVQLVEAEFERVGAEPMPEPTRTQRGLAGGDSAGAGAAGGGGAESAADEMFPRQDLHALVGASIYKRLGDANWKERKAALEAIQAAVESASGRILPGISGDMYTALKQRLQDPNKNLITVALGVLGLLTTASGAALAANIRIVALSTMHCLADKKPHVRVAALAAMTAWAGASGGSVDQAVLPALPTALADTSPELRSALLKWTADTLGARARLPDLGALVAPLFVCLQDRNVEVRKQAARVLGLAVKSCGFEAVHDACGLQLRGAAHATVAPVVEEFRHAVSAADGAPPPGAARLGQKQRSAASAADRAPSPAAEPVMTASQLLGRAPVGLGSSSAGAGSSSAGVGSSSAGLGSSSASGPGMLRRPMAVRRPVSGASAAPRTTRPARAGSAQGRAAPTMASQLARMSSEELEHVPPVLDCDPRARELRARRDAAASTHGAPRWAQLGDARTRAELEAQLAEQCAAHLNPRVQRQLFSQGHYRDRDFLGGLTQLDEAISVPGLAQRYGLAAQAGAGEDSLAARYLAHSDLLLKYVSLRMYDGSTHTLLKSLDVLERLAGLAEQAGAAWGDSDAQAVVPALVARLGDAKEAVRARARRVLTQQVPRLWAASKVFAALLDHGVGHRGSARVRQEALDCVCVLVRERAGGQLGAVCAQPARAVPVLAQAVGDRDSAVRAAALAVLVAVGELLPGGADELWRLCGRVPDKERALLEERLRRSGICVEPRPASRNYAEPRPVSRIGGGSSDARPASRIGGVRARLPAAGSTSGIGRPLPAASSGPAGASNGAGASRLARPPAPASQPAPAAPSSATPMFSLDFDSLSLPAYSAATSEQLGAGVRGLGVQMDAEPIGYGAGRSERLRAALAGLPSAGAAAARATDFASMGDGERAQWLAAAVDDLRGDAAGAALERLHGLLRTADGDDARSPALAHLRRHVSAIATGVAALLGDASRPRVRRDAVALLLDVFGSRRLALWARPAAVHTLLRALVELLVDPDVSPTSRARTGAADPTGAQLHKAANSVMVRVLERADRSAALVALIALLDAATAAAAPNPLVDAADIVRADMGDIVMRCLWRLSKHLKEDLRAQLAAGAAFPAVGDARRAAFVRVDHVLLATHRFFRSTPNSAWRQREDAERWTFGDLPKRTVKTISHTFAMELRGAVWAHFGPVVREVQRERPVPGPPPAADAAALDAWARDLHADMCARSEAWEYLARALEDAGDGSERPTPEQALAVYRAAQADGGDDDDERSYEDAGPASWSPAPSATRSPASRASHSPLLPAARPLAHTPSLAASSPAIDRTRSPAAGESSAYVPVSTGSSLERLRALRERIGGARPPSATTAGSSSVPASGQSPSPQMSSPQMSSPQMSSPPAEQTPSMDDIRQRIAFMRNSLRSHK
ncbi:hypothetical protein IWW51_000706 [Coemansia sp. RSA 2702]|nr:hypothetical protein IWW51_000706 [Coemansia sp. RSA 2702]